MPARSSNNRMKSSEGQEPAMVNSRTTFVLLASFSMLTATVIVSAQTPAAPKLSVSAIQVAPVDSGDVEIPPEFRFAVYERLVEQVIASGMFKKVYRAGDHAADGIPDLVTLHTKILLFKEGRQTKREVTTVLGATSVDVTASVTAKDGHEIFNKKITGRVRFFGENLGVTNDIAKRITKLVNKSFSAAS
jgi:hypothetical protein